MPLLDCRVALLLAAAAPAWPQARLEVASIRPSQPGITVRDARHNFHGDRFEAHAMTVGDLLDMLNGYQLYRVVGGPDWMRADRYDIEAKAGQPLDAANQQQAVMALLAERFHLKSHRETREVPGIVLRAPRASRSGLKQAGRDEKYSIHMDGGGDFVFTAVPMSGMTNYLSQMLKAPVVDETKLKSAYDFKLALSKIEPQPGNDAVREAAEAAGFRLENRRVSLEVTVVDRCERPAAN